MRTQKRIMDILHDFLEKESYQMKTIFQALWYLSIHSARKKEKSRRRTWIEKKYKIV